MYRENLREVLLNRPGECKGKSSGSSSQPGWRMYRESLREVLFNRPGECTGKVLEKFLGKFSCGLQNVQRIS
jgi:hypothetical protein